MKTTGKHIIEKISNEMDITNPEQVKNLNLLSHTLLIELHARALACHCECLAMNAENMWAAIANSTPVYLQRDYLSIMVKWGLVDEKGKPTI